MTGYSVLHAVYTRRTISAQPSADLTPTNHFFRFYCLNNRNPDFRVCILQRILTYCVENFAGKNESKEESTISSRLGCFSAICDVRVSNPRSHLVYIYGVN